MDWRHRIAGYVADEVEESRTLDFKRDLDLDPKSKRIECLKDLTAMANGGGGVVIFGVDEKRGGDARSCAGQVAPLHDRRLVNRLENAVRDPVTL